MYESAEQIELDYPFLRMHKVNTRRENNRCEDFCKEKTNKMLHCVAYSIILAAQNKNNIYNDSIS